MSSRSATKELVRVVLDGIFPPTCVGCSGEGEWLCGACLETISFVGRVALPEDDPLGTLVAVSSYQQPLIGGLIRSFKYKRALCLEEEAFQKVFTQFRDTSEGLSSLLPVPTMIVPLSMDPERERTRGMDHTLRLAELVQAVFLPNVPIIQALTRTRATETNARLSSIEARAANVEDVFACQHFVQGSEILLIDDVYTSGATMREASTTLHRSGAASVQGFVVAIGQAV